MQLLGKMLGDPNKKELKLIQPLIDKINDLEEEIQALSDEELTAKTQEFRKQLALHLKGGLVLEDELLALFREALNKVEPLAEKCSAEQIRAALSEHRREIEHKRDPEYMLRDHLRDTLSDCFEKTYESLSPALNAARVAAAMDLAEESQEWPDEAERPQLATLGLLKKVEPLLEQVDEDIQIEAFKKAWLKFDEARKVAPDKEEGTDERLEGLLGDILRRVQHELVALRAEEMDELLPEIVKRYKSGKALDDLLPEAFAVVREAGKRTIHMRHYDVQLVGGVVHHQGKIAEMRTGEGKTLVATLPAYLNGLTGKGVHIVTTNDYLARRDAEWMGQIHRFLGLTVGVIVNAVSPQTDERRAAYQTDITYGTNNEFGFDYLRDNMVSSLDQTVQRDLNYAIVDEVDNILIDEARTPLIISGAGQESTEMYAKFARWAPRLKAEEDYTVEEKTRTVILTDSGITKIEQLSGVKNLYEENSDLPRYMENAIKAQVIFHRDKDYIVKDGEVIIVDEFTGRQMPGRRYSEGLHQAIEAKEGVTVQRENHTLATITFQNFFRLYNKLSGMTGTAMTEAEELNKIYSLDVVQIPTNKPMIREDQSDYIYRTAEGKYDAIIAEIKECHEQGQPVLVGTTSVEISEYLSQKLEREGIEHNVLNAKHHEREAHIIAQAGRSGAVTIATNMAGRGTDIVLGGNPEGYFEAILRKHAEQVDFIRDMPESNAEERAEKAEAIQEYLANMTEEEKEELFRVKKLECDEDHERVVDLGGLYIIGTERHESRRIDLQLRGRSGRQGDPGESRFYLSLEDELMRRFGGDRVSRIMEMAGMGDDIPLENKMVSRLIEQSQTRVEGYNFDMRKNVVEYDDVIAKQREVIYADRRAVLEHADMHERVLSMIRGEVTQIINEHIPSNMVEDEEQLEKLFTVLENWMVIQDELLPENMHAVRRGDLTKKLTDAFVEHYEARGKQLDQLAEDNPGLGVPTLRDVERAYTLQVLDRLWMDHIDALDVMRASIGFRSIGQRDPLVEFKNEAYTMFENLKGQIQRYIVEQLLRLTKNDITITVKPPEPPKRKGGPRPLRTNADAIARASGQAKADEAEVPRTPSRRQGPNRQQNGRAQSVNSNPRQLNKVGRNDPCPCGSGKKYKKCHGA
ncbi:MAG TPA: preprotein translocase subunit SecA [Ktedonobacteraceae bacterium]